MNKIELAIQIFNFHRKGYTYREIANVLRIPVHRVWILFCKRPPKYLSTIPNVKKPNSVVSTETRDAKVNMPVIGEVLVTFRPRFEQDEKDPSQYHTCIDIISIHSTQNDKEYAYNFLGELSRLRVVQACLSSMPQI